MFCTSSSIEGYLAAIILIGMMKFRVGYDASGYPQGYVGWNGALHGVEGWNGALHGVEGIIKMGHVVSRNSKW